MAGLLPQEAKERDVCILSRECRLALAIRQDMIRDPLKPFDESSTIGCIILCTSSDNRDER